MATRPLTMLERSRVLRLFHHPCGLIAKHVAQLVGAVVVLAQMLELKAEHECLIGPDAEGRILHERLDVARSKNKALVLVLELEDILDALA